MLFFADIFFVNQPTLQDFQLNANSLSLGVYKIIEQVNWLQFPLAFSLIILQALTINGFVNKNRLAKHFNYITAICYILIINCFTDVDSLNPVLIANTFLLLGLHALYHTYEKKVSTIDIYNAGFYVALASLCYFSTSIYFLGFSIGLIVMRPLDWREGAILLSGFVTPLFLVGTYFYLTDNFMWWWEHDIARHFNGIIHNLKFSWAFYLGLGIIVFVFLWSLLNVSNLYYRTTIREQKGINIIFLLVFVTSLSLLIQHTLDIFYFAILAIPITILLSMNLQSIKKRSAAEFIHLLFLLACISIQYQEVLGR
ncbi:MAG: hypothetical protein MK212_06820 [Saprospiraceae bacterium]|nr:hypothetical protein [Saprospiraceae bacterium]